MNWRSWFFPHSPATRAEKAISEAKRRTNAVMQPLSDLVVGIVSASWQCTQEAKPHLRINPEFTKAPWTPRDQDIYIFYEFLYFFMHLMNREAHRQLSIDKLENLQQTIGSLILPSAVGTFFGHWPKEFTDGIERGLYEKLNDAEGEYACCTKFFPDTTAWLPGHIPHMDGSALFSRVAINVLNLAGYESNAADAETLVLAKVIETAAMAKMVEAPEKPDPAGIQNFGCLKNFDELVERAGAAIDAFENDGLSLPQVLQECRMGASSQVKAVITP